MVFLACAFVLVSKQVVHHGMANSIIRRYDSVGLDGALLGLTVSCKGSYVTVA